jgi:Ca-activated chloride channel homolog
VGFFRSLLIAPLLLAPQWRDARPAKESSPAQETPVFRSDVRLVRMLCTVKGPGGELIGGMGRDEFQVFDNDVEQTLSVFERSSQQPLTISLLFDTSSSTNKDARYELDSARKFLRTLLREGNPKDAAALYSFNDEVTLEQPFTRQIDKLSSRLGGIHGNGGTAIYDAIYFASQEMARRDGRHVVVAITDGGDTASRKRFHDALEALHKANAVFYSIVVVPIESGSGRNTGGENALIQFSQWTGGKVFFPNTASVLDKAFADILQDLRTQYLLGYYPRNLAPTLDRFHRVRIGVQRPGHSVSARNGYYSDDVAALPPAPSQRGPAKER